MQLLCSVMQLPLAVPCPGRARYVVLVVAPTTCSLLVSSGVHRPCDATDPPKGLVGHDPWMHPDHQDRWSPDDHSRGVASLVIRMTSSCVVSAQHARTGVPAMPVQDMCIAACCWWTMLCLSHAEVCMDPPSMCDHP